MPLVRTWLCHYLLGFTATEHLSTLDSFLRGEVSCFWNHPPNSAVAIEVLTGILAEVALPLPLIQSFRVFYSTGLSTGL